MSNPNIILHCQHCGNRMKLEADLFGNGRHLLYICEADSPIHTAFDERTEIGSHRTVILSGGEINGYLPEDYEQLPILLKTGEIPF